MTPSISTQRNNQSQDKCKHCGGTHRGACMNPKYLANKNFKCGCDSTIDLHGFETHCCLCKWGANFSKMEWNSQIEGKARCWHCKRDGRIDENTYEKENNNQRRFPKLTCKNIVYKGDQVYGECGRESRGMTYVGKREFRKWNDQTEQVELITDAVCDKCIDHENRYILQKVDAHKVEYCHLCGTQSSRPQMESEDYGYKTNYYCNLNCLYAKKIQRETDANDDRVNVLLNKYANSSRYAGSGYGFVTVEAIRQRLEDNRNIEVDHEVRKITEKKTEILNEIIQYPEKLDQVMDMYKKKLRILKKIYKKKF